MQQVSFYVQIESGVRYLTIVFGLWMWQRMMRQRQILLVMSTENDLFFFCWKMCEIPLYELFMAYFHMKSSSVFWNVCNIIGKNLRFFFMSRHLSKAYTVSSSLVRWHKMYKIGMECSAQKWRLSNLCYELNDCFNVCPHYRETTMR